tara:strand:- start:1582 stop:1884 length:303 start_codon:yes stop_codon:yes gene_type:complete
MSDLNTLSKGELEAIGRQHGVELDRRLLKGKMVKQLQEYINSVPETPVEEPLEAVLLSDDLSELDSISSDKLISLAKDYDIDASTIGSKGKLIISLIEKL